MNKTIKYGFPFKKQLHLSDCVIEIEKVNNGVWRWYISINHNGRFARSFGSNKMFLSSVKGEAKMIALQVIREHDEERYWELR